MQEFQNGFGGSMNIQELLKGRKCECGKTHTCAIKHVMIEEGAIDRIADYVKAYDRILLIADGNTYAVCGERVKALLGNKCENVLIYQREGLLVPNEEAIEEMKQCLTEETKLILGIGSSVIQDLCKYVSFYAKLPYAIVAAYSCS